jgi:formylglycine-generating enzyme required for sulfatase activity
MATPVCPTRNTLDAFRAGSLSADERGTIESHLRSCPRCLEYVCAKGEAGLGGAGKPRGIVAASGLSHGAAVSRVSQDGDGPQLESTLTLDGGLGHIRDYRLLEILGQGGMGVVYKAIHTQLDRLVALKLVKPGRCEDSQTLARFQREMKAVGKLSHPNVIAAHDAGEHEGQRYLVMEYVEGINLSALLERLGRLLIPDACELVRQAAVALEHIDEHGLIHRDIKPSNLMLSIQGQVKVLDLGLALLQTAGETGQELTQDGRMMGTLDYMAPEQLSDSHHVDIRADIYSLGATLYKLLTGHAPYGGLGLQTPVQKIAALHSRPISPISGRRPEIPKELADVVHRMLRRNLEDRYASPAEVVFALGRFTSGAQLPALAARGLGRDVSGVMPPEHSCPTNGGAEVGNRDTEAGARPAPQTPARRPAIEAAPENPRIERPAGGMAEGMSEFRMTIQRPLNARYPLLVQAPSIVGDPSGTLGLDQPAAAALAARIALEGFNPAGFADLGRQLFEALFTETLRSTFAVNRHTASPDGRESALRLLLHVLDDDVRRLPWELAYDGFRKEWLATGRATPLSRYVDASPVNLPPVTLPLRLLVCVAEPNDGRYLDAISQIMRLEASLRHLIGEGLLEVSVLQHTQLDSLRAELEQRGPQIVHFIGHGYGSQGRTGVFLEHADGSGDRLTIEVFRQLLRRSGTVGLAVLNADESDEVAHGLAAEGIASIGMRQPLSLEASHHLCQTLYASLALGRPLDAAVNEARFRIQLECGEHRRDWWLPMAYLPRGDARILSLAATTPAPDTARVADVIPGNLVEVVPAPPAREPPPSSSGAAVQARGPRDSFASQMRSRISQRRPPQPPRAVQPEGLAKVKAGLLRAAPALLVLSAAVILLGLYGLANLLGNKTPSRAVAPPLPASEPPPPPPPGQTGEMILVQDPILHKGYWDDSVTVRLLAKYNREGVNVFDALLTTLPRKVEVKPFFIDKYEITNAQYEAFLAAAGGDRQSSHPADKPGNQRRSKYATDSRFSRPNQPVVGIDWFDAYAYAKWTGKRLPTEDEWELAARSADGRAYPWGNEFTDLKYLQIAPPLSGPLDVTALTADRHGAPLGMAGNVSEWIDSPTQSDGKVVFRGGAWRTAPGDVFGLTFLPRLADREVCDNDLGFRCARDRQSDQESPPEGMVAIAGGAVTLGGEETPLLDLLRLEKARIRNLTDVFLRHKPERVAMKPFRIDRFEVSNAQYRTFLDYVCRHGDERVRHPGQAADKDHTPALWTDPKYNGDDQPVVGVDWYDAYAYARWAGKRLPTADEWEMAARGGTQRLYPWGDRFDETLCNCGEGPMLAPTPVQDFPGDQSPLDVRNLAGNVSEWTADPWPDLGPGVMLIRGGAFDRPCRSYGVVYVRSLHADRMHRENDLGFRCAADP